VPVSKFEVGDQGGIVIRSILVGELP